MGTRIMAEEILDHALEIIYLLTGEHLNNSLKKNDMKIDKKMMSERILNHALDIIYLLTGKGPTQCDDLTVYFPKEELDCTGQKELYKDAAKENRPARRSSDNRESKSPALHDENQDFILVNKERKEEQVGQDFLQVQVKSEHFVDLQDENLDAVSVNESVSSGNDILQVEIKPEPVDDESTPPDGCTSLSIELDGSHKAAWPSGQQVDKHTEFYVGSHQDPTEIQPNKSTLDEPGDEIPSYSRDQTPPTVDGGLGHRLNNVLWSNKQVKKTTTSTNCTTRSRRKWGPVEAPRSKKPHQCKVCGKGFDYNSRLIVHQRSHTGEKPHMCHECGKHFADKSNLSAHQKTHARENHYMCGECGQEFAYKYSLLLHQKSHAQEKCVSCNICGDRFASKSGLKAHKASHTGEKPYMCHQCGKHFANKSYLTVHQRTHSGEKPHVCSNCGKHFADRSNLISHQRSHTGEKPHSCMECGKCFAYKYYLITHQRTHTGEKPHQCNECGRHFADKSNLIAHRKSHRRAAPFVQ